MKNCQQIRAQVIEKRQADAHKKQDNVDNPAQQAVNGF